jgi:putative membrane protein
MSTDIYRNSKEKEFEMMNWYGRDGYGWMDGGGMLVMGLIWILIIGLGIWLVTWLTHRDKAASLPKEQSPRQILDRRLASGEIDAAAYAQARRLIEGQVPGAEETK